MRAQTPSEQITAERRFQLLIEAVVDYAIFMLDPSGYITNWNAGAQRIKGYTADEIIGQHFSCFYSEADRAAGVPNRSLQIAVSEGKFEAEGWRFRKDGSRFWASVVLDPVYSQGGDLLGFAKVTRDITERHEAQRRLDEAREQLFQAQKMEAIGHLAGGIAHDFNNLLTVIGVGAEIAEPLVGDNEKLKRIVRNMRHAASRGESLTRQLLAFSRRQPLRAERIDLPTQLHTLSELLGRCLRGDISIVETFASELRPIEVDPRQFELALLNVGLNARDAMPNGGIITITAHNAPHDPESGQAGDFVAIEIADNGFGMSEEVRVRAFEPFFTTKDVGHGSGLGLSQAFGFAKQSGGSLVLESELGRGTKATFYLPASGRTPSLVSERQAPAGPRPDAGRKRRASEATILVVEDDAVVAELATDLLSGFGYDLHVARDAQAALDILRSGTRVDLVFSDIMMPGGMNGADLARTVREEFPGVFVLLATGYAQAAIEAAKEFPLIGKPYSRDQLVEQIETILGAD